MQKIKRWKNAFKDGGMYSKAKGGKKDLQPEQALDVYLDALKKWVRVTEWQQEGGHGLWRKQTDI